MCAHCYADVNMASAPSRCMKVHSKAFANELADRAPSAREEAFGNRFPLDEDRVLACRYLVETLGSQGVKGAPRVRRQGERGQAAVGDGPADGELPVGLHAQSSYILQFELASEENICKKCAHW